MQRLGGSSCKYAETPQLGLAPKRGLNKQTLTREGCIKSQGNSRRPSRSAQRLGALPATLPRPAALAHTRMGSANKPSVRTKRICEGRMKKSGDPRPSSCSRRRLGGSSCTQRPRQMVQSHARSFITKHDKGHRARYGPGVRRLGPPKVSTDAPGQQSQG